MVRWIAAARRTPDLLGHGYLQTHSGLASAIKEHRLAFHDDVSTVSSLSAMAYLSSRLLYQDSQVALAALWMLLEGDKLAPQVGALFRDWEWPQCDLEFDHIGLFVRNPGGLYSYEGGESKFDISGNKF